MKKESTSFEKEEIERVLNGQFYGGVAIEKLRRCLGIDDLEEGINTLKSELEQLKQIKSTCVDEEMGELRKVMISRATDIFNNTKSDFKEIELAKYVVNLLFKYPHQSKELL